MEHILTPISQAETSSKWHQVAERIWTYNGRPSFDPTRLLADVQETTLTYRNAFIARWEVKNSNLRGAIYNSKGQILPGSARPDVFRGYSNLETVPASRMKSAIQIKGRCIYLGVMFNHFGHFLVESLARAWAAINVDPSVRVIFHWSHWNPAINVFSDPTKARLPPHVTTVLDALGIDLDRLILADTDLVVEELVIPSSQFRLSEMASTNMCTVYDHLRGQILKKKDVSKLPKKIYFTRRKLKVWTSNLRSKWAVNEEAVEELFVRRGFEIIAPEQLPFEEQIALTSNATKLAAMTGSSLHMILFNSRPDAEVISVDFREIEAQYMLEAARRVRALHIYCLKERHQDARPELDVAIIDQALTGWLDGAGTSTPNRGNSIVGATTRLPFSRETASLSPTERRDGESSSRRRIKRLAEHLNAQSCLAIGPSGVQIFTADASSQLNLSKPDVEFEADKKRSASDTTVSDQFFLEQGDSRKFDIVYLDGLHTFQQTFRDFCNSMLTSHERTVWIVNGVLPADPYGALPSPIDAVELRERAGKAASKPWQGDAFKLLFVIHDFFPTLTYATIATPENAQAIIWRRPRVGYRPVLASLERIERLEFFNLPKYEAVLARKSEDDAFKHLLESPSTKSIEQRSKVSSLRASG